VRNSGKIEADVNQVLHVISDETAPPSYGFNSAEDIYGDLYKMGIVDPCKVVITALTKAASVGALLLTTEVLVTDIPDNTPPQRPLHY
jgi:chaperonin GroEL (HSP60 family)